MYNNYKSFIKEPIYETRQTKLKYDQSYGIGRTTLVKKWKITSPGVTAKLCINGIVVDLPFMDGITFDVKQIRDYLRNIIPCSEEDNKLCVAESTIFGSQILATEYYSYFPSHKLFDFIFTGELSVSFIPNNMYHDIDIEEEFIVRT